MPLECHRNATGIPPECHRNATVDEPGRRIVVIDEVFTNCAAYLAVHPQAKENTEFAAEVFPEREPSRPDGAMRTPERLHLSRAVSIS